MLTNITTTLLFPIGKIPFLKQLDHHLTADLATLYQTSSVILSSVIDIRISNTHIPGVVKANNLYKKVQNFCYIDGI